MLLAIRDIPASAATVEFQGSADIRESVGTVAVRDTQVHLDFPGTQVPPVSRVTVQRLATVAYPASAGIAGTPAVDSAVSVASLGIVDSAASLASPVIQGIPGRKDCKVIQAIQVEPEQAVLADIRVRLASVAIQACRASQAFLATPVSVDILDTLVQVLAVLAEQVHLGLVDTQVRELLDIQDIRVRQDFLDTARTRGTAAYPVTAESPDTAGLDIQATPETQAQIIHGKDRTMAVLHIMSTTAFPITAHRMFAFLPAPAIYRPTRRIGI